MTGGAVVWTITTVTQTSNVGNLYNVNPLQHIQLFVTHIRDINGSPVLRYIAVVIQQ